MTLNFRSFFLHSAGKVDEKATQLHAIASLKVLLDATKPQANAGPDGSANGSAQTGTGGGGGGAPGSALADGDAHDSGRASQGTEVRLVFVGTRLTVTSFEKSVFISKFHPTCHQRPIAYS